VCARLPSDGRRALIDWTPPPWPRSPVRPLGRRAGAAARFTASPRSRARCAPPVLDVRPRRRVPCSAAPGTERSWVGRHAISGRSRTPSSRRLQTRRPGMMRVVRGRVPMKNGASTTSAATANRTYVRCCRQTSQVIRRHPVGRRAVRSGAPPGNPGRRRCCKTSYWPHVGSRSHRPSGPRVGLVAGPWGADTSCSACSAPAILARRCGGPISTCAGRHHPILTTVAVWAWRRLLRARRRVVSMRDRGAQVARTAPRLFRRRDYGWGCGGRSPRAS
jgi:hypothetical protein